MGFLLLYLSLVLGQWHSNGVQSGADTSFRCARTLSQATQVLTNPSTDRERFEGAGIALDAAASCAQAVSQTARAELTPTLEADLFDVYCQVVVSTLEDSSVDGQPIKFNFGSAGCDLLVVLISLTGFVKKSREANLSFDEVLMGLDPLLLKLDSGHPRGEYLSNVRTNALEAISRLGYELDAPFFGVIAEKITVLLTTYTPLHSRFGEDAMGYGLFRESASHTLVGFVEQYGSVIPDEVINDFKMNNYIRNRLNSLSLLNFMKMLEHPFVLMR